MIAPELCLDIETAGAIRPELLNYLKAKLKPRGNLKDPAKIEADLEAKEQALVEKAALSPRTGRVVAVGIGLRPEPGAVWENQVFVDEVNDEKLLLETVDKLLATVNPLHVYTFNGRKFDFPFLMARSMCHGLELQYRWPLHTDRRHLDLFEVLGREGALAEWMLAILGKGKPSGGNEIETFMVEEKWEDIKVHCLEDIVGTEKLVDLLMNVADWRMKQ